MGLLARKLEWRATSKLIGHPKDPGLVNILGLGIDTSSGIPVDPDRALCLGAVYQAVRIISETVAQVPLLTYERTGEMGKRRATDHPLFSVLASRPNPEQTSFEWRETMVGHMALRGNAYSEIVMDGGGAVRELWPIHPDRVRLERNRQRQRSYVINLPEGGQVVFPARKVLHLKTLWGKSVVSLARESIGVGLALDEYAGRFFSNGASPRGAMMMPVGKNLGATTELAEPSRKRLRQSFEETHGGVKNFHRILILEDGMTWQQIGMSQQDAQFLESRRFQVTDIARWFNLPAHMLNDLEKATFSNISQQAIAFVRYSMMPWFGRIEQGLSMKLLTETEQRTHFVEFLVDGLLRGDMEARGKFYTQLFQIGVLSPNEIRSRENDNPYEGGDEHFVQLNMVPVSQSRELLDSDATPGDDGGSSDGGDRSRLAAGGGLKLRQRRAAEERRRIALLALPLFSQAAGRLVRGEDRHLRQAVERLLELEDLDVFQNFIDDFYVVEGDFRQFARRQLEPAFTELASRITPVASREAGSEPDKDFLPAFVAGLTDAFTARHAESSRGQLRALANEDGDRRGRILERLDGWKDRRSRKIAVRETTRVNAAVTQKIGRLAGLQRLQWVTFDENCSFCTELSGRIIGTKEMFVPAGTELIVDGAAPMIIRGSIGHPPLHSGCTCTVVVVNQGG